jgi:hypothetical protein
MFPMEGGEGVTVAPGTVAGALTASAAYGTGDDIQEQVRGFELDAMVSLAGPIANVRHTGRADAFWKVRTATSKWHTAQPDSSRF